MARPMLKIYAGKIINVNGAQTLRVVRRGVFIKGNIISEW